MTPVEEIKNKLDLVEYVRQHVQLSKSGSSWRGLCPFHKEKNPSFYVSSQKQFWYCFGCHRGGDLFKFVMEMEHMEFPEALKFLAEKAGVQLEREDPKLRSKKIRILDALKEAADFYQKNLTKDSPPYKYLLERGLKDSTICEFKLGFATPGWRNLYEHLTKIGFSPEEMESAGLILRQISSTEGQPSGYYDRFRSRIMFPIFDANSRVIGFTGRVFGEVEEGGKYINSPDTIVFKKSEVLYGFEHTKEEMRKTGLAVLVEGQMDFLLALPDGIKNVVASSGTALTQEQLLKLKRVAQNLTLAFDMDAAGQEATDRSIAKAQMLGLEVKIATLPAGKDVADFVKLYPQKLREILDTSLQSMDYFFTKAFSKFGTASHQEKRELVNYLIPKIKSL
ncbi:MAG: DNA primase, partial [Candidatus Paceibacteria bacterium]